MKSARTVRRITVFVTWFSLPPTGFLPGQKGLSRLGERRVAGADRLPEICFAAGERFDLPFTRARTASPGPLPSLAEPPGWWYGLKFKTGFHS